jgi:SAM-dependent methyltransferase
MQDHYSFVNSKYHDSLFYSKDSEYEQWQFRLLLSLLDINHIGTYSILDLGGGTGRLAQFLKEQLSKETNVVCVDKSRAMLESTNNVPGIAAIHADAVNFIAAAMSEVYDVIICKEIIHYIQSEPDIKVLTEGILRSLKPGGSCIICTRPHQDIEYPFFNDAMKKWQASQPPFEEYVTALKQAGFSQIEVIHAVYPMVVTLEAWLDFIEQRIWSIFSYAEYSDAELQRGIAEIRARYGDANEAVLSFKEKLIFIKAVR